MQAGIASLPLESGAIFGLHPSSRSLTTSARVMRERDCTLNHHCGSAGMVGYSAHDAGGKQQTAHISRCMWRKHSETRGIVLQKGELEAMEKEKSGESCCWKTKNRYPLCSHFPDFPRVLPSGWRIRHQKAWFTAMLFVHEALERQQPLACDVCARHVWLASEPAGHCLVALGPGAIYGLHRSQSNNL